MSFNVRGLNPLLELKYTNRRTSVEAYYTGHSHIDEAVLIYDVLRHHQHQHQAGLLLQPPLGCQNSRVRVQSFALLPTCVVATKCMNVGSMLFVTGNFQ